LGPLLEGTYTLRVQTAQGELNVQNVVVGGDILADEAANAQLAVRFRTERGAGIAARQLLFIPLVE
jgi:hypothetical protein